MLSTACLGRLTWSATGGCALLVTLRDAEADALRAHHPMAGGVLHLRPGAVGARPHPGRREQPSASADPQGPHARPAAALDHDAGGAARGAAEPELEAHAPRRDARRPRHDAERSGGGGLARERAEPPAERVVLDRAEALAGGVEAVVVPAAVRE